MTTPFDTSRLHQDTCYVGRFAPSPSGPLHLGSLVAALGSYLRARQMNGKWLLRIEDIDPPREQAGADELIKDALIAHGLLWDEAVIYQHNSHERYEQALTWLRANGHCYFCQCTRKQRLANPKGESCACAQLALNPQGCATVLRNTDAVHEIDDLALGRVSFDEQCKDDFILRRKDGLYAYQLAVVIDDVDSGVTEVVRGADILPATAYQLALYNLFKQPAPAYVHLPLVMGDNGQKLSKQNHAPALNNERATNNLCAALETLGLRVPSYLNNALVPDILDFAVHNWSVALIADNGHAFDNRIDA
ncbi:tRNA glutamyl-Q(34) synthetase GluQRS [Paraglaciecola chathamensis]|uniref:tRNA glutamyl-Q(34) synthetase GluQRS n=1 Tax=Paraglaciecola chathamensis TaxID=368405 RepID=UPI0026FDBECD|nr:tRNA glutamyl-Q(34) synthetase GluQRS [Paraglaciecola chathamensis]MDO6561043.1 tRNA glutamyl-Q(34) synthetase GluQRS [Paraglaciecola chathamensis]